MGPQGIVGGGGHLVGTGPCLGVSAGSWPRSAMSPALLGQGARFQVLAEARGDPQVHAAGVSAWA